MADQIIRWEPPSSALSLRDVMDRLFEESFGREEWNRYDMLETDRVLVPDTAILKLEFRESPVRVLFLSERKRDFR